MKMDGDGWTSSIKWNLIIVDKKDVHGWNSSIVMLVTMLNIGDASQLEWPTHLFLTKNFKQWSG
jgi:hypothetical protein